MGVGVWPVNVSNFATVCYDIVNVSKLDWISFNYF